jgi:hypothetical protein
MRDIRVANAMQNAPEARITRVAPGVRRWVAWVTFGQYTYATMANLACGIPAVSDVSWAKDHHSCVCAPSETTLVWFYYYRSWRREP